MRILVAVTIAAGLAACGEIPQDAPKPYAGKEDTKAYAGDTCQGDKAKYDQALAKRTKVGGWLLVGILAAIAIFYLVRGPLRLHGQPTGRLIERFNAIERVSHWVMAICFVVLALSGIVILFGKHIVLPWLGYGAFSWLTVLSKNGIWRS